MLLPSLLVAFSLAGKWRSNTNCPKPSRFAGLCSKQDGRSFVVAFVLRWRRPGRRPSENSVPSQLFASFPIVKRVVSMNRSPAAGPHTGRGARTNDHRGQDPRPTPTPGGCAGQRQDPKTRQISSSFMPPWLSVALPRSSSVPTSLPRHASR